MKKLHIFDTSVASDNVGDEIIVNSSLKHLKLYEKNLYVTTSASHVYPGDYVRQKLLKDVSAAIVTGSNLLTDTYSRKNLFRLTWPDARAIEKKLVVFGAGWRSLPILGNEPLRVRGKRVFKRAMGWNALQKRLYQTIMSDTLVHSVRSKMAVTSMAEMGIENVLWTACPTMWELTPEHCAGIATDRKDEVVFAITSYKHFSEKEAEILGILDKIYKVIYFWPQSYEDLMYFKAKLLPLVSTARVEIIRPNLKSYDEVLSGEVDYVGSRLHGGIRALQHKNRTVIIAVDSRAAEIGRDTGLPVIKMGEVNSRLKDMIYSSFETKIQLPVENIRKFVSQFDSIDA